MEFLSVIVNRYMCLLCDILKQKSLKISCIFSKNMLKEFEKKCCIFLENVLGKFEKKCCKKMQHGLKFVYQILNQPPKNYKDKAKKLIDLFSKKPLTNSC